MNATPQAAVAKTETTAAAGDARSMTGPTTLTAQRSSLWSRYGWILGRLASGVLTLFLVSIIIFAATMLLPGDIARIILGRDATQASIEALTIELGLDQPLIVQYLDWLRGAVTLDFGNSLVSRAVVTDAMLPRLLNTLGLVGMVSLVSIPLALAIGVSGAIRADRHWDRFVNGASIVIAALPEFVIGLLLTILLATGLMRVLPAVVIVPPGASPFSAPLTLVLPVATLVIVSLPYLIRQTRASLIDTLTSEYITMAELKGLPERIIVIRHALRNSLIPSIHASALTVAFMIGGTIIIEYLFNFPGMGLALIEAVATRDLPVIQFIVMIFAAGYVILNLIADILTVFVTPKLRTR